MAKPKRRPQPPPPVDQAPGANGGQRGTAYAKRPFGAVTRDGVLEYQGYQDAHLIDRMHRVAQLSDKQHQVAQRVLEQHGDAGFEPAVVGNYGPQGWNKGHDDALEEAAAITRFRKLLGSCSEAAALQLHSMCLGLHPGVARLASLQAALDDLAKKWGVG